MSDPRKKTKPTKRIEIKDLTATNKHLTKTESKMVKGGAVGPCNKPHLAGVGPCYKPRN